LLWEGCITTEEIYVRIYNFYYVRVLHAKEMSMLVCVNPHDCEIAGFSASIADRRHDMSRTVRGMGDYSLY
jgi:hypothetical protein